MNKKSLKKNISLLTRALIKNSTDEQINIKAIAILLPKNTYVAQNKQAGDWRFFRNFRPYLSSVREGCWEESRDFFGEVLPFNIKPAKDWKKSVIQCGVKDD